MENIYEILEKHFQQQTSEKEEQTVRGFREQNSSEYLLLQQLWYSHNKIDVTDYDSGKAWIEVVAHAKQKNSHSFSIYSRLRQVAAVTLIVIVGSLFAYFVLQHFNRIPAMIEMATLENQSDSVLLADGSTVWLNRNSRLYCPPKFIGKTRTVKLEGEAYFVVAKNAEKPFKVETKHSTISVLGTTFNVFTNSQQTEINLQSGKVNVQSLFDNTSVNLLSNYKAIATETSLTKSPISNPNYLSWKTGVFVFNDTPLEQVIHDLNRFYPKPLLCCNPNFKSIIFKKYFLLCFYI